MLHLQFALLQGIIQKNPNYTALGSALQPNIALQWLFQITVGTLYFN